MEGEAGRGLSLLKKNMYMTTVVKKTALLFLFLIPAPVLFAQLGHGGVPAPVDDYSRIPVEDLTGQLPAFEELAARDLPRKEGVLRFAEDIAVRFTPATHGTWEVLPGGEKVWRMVIRYKGARSLGLTFGRYRLDAGERVFIYDPSGRHVLGAFTDDNNKPWHSLAVQPLPGGTLIVEYHLPRGKDSHDGLVITKVSIGYLDIFHDPRGKDGFFGSSGPCNTDINCSAGDNWQEDKRSVVRIFINNNELCTGVLMNTAVNDATPYILSAGHGIESDDDAANSVFVFGYESPYCNGPDGSVNKSISGSEMIARAKNLDFTLVKMSRYPPFTFYPYYAGWDVSDNTPAPPTVTIHHPQGDVKKISVDNEEPVTASYDVYDENTFWKILQWDVGTTEPGSSGAPLFDAHHRVVGTLSGGDAHCGNSINDYFQKLSAQWDDYADTSEQLKHWLDPKEFGFQLWNGFDPYTGATKSCDTLTNIEEGETLTLDPYAGTDGGYWTGHNTDRTSLYAEQFENTTYISMTGIYIKPGIVKYDAASDHITVRIWSGSSKPEEVIVEKDVTLSFFRDSVWNFIDFDTLVTVEGNFFAGFEVYYDNNVGDPLTDQFAVFQTEARDTYGDNTAYYYQNGSWTAFSGTPGHSVYISLAISPVMCQEIPDLGIFSPRTAGQQALLLLYPNPASDQITILPDDGILAGGTLHITDLAGKVVRERVYHPWQGSLHIPLAGLREGVYLVVLETPGKIYRNKLIIQKR